MHQPLGGNASTIVEDATRGGGAECAARRDPQQWSVCEVVEHLQRAYLGTAKGFETLPRERPADCHRAVTQDNGCRVSWWSTSVTSRWDARRRSTSFQPASSTCTPCSTPCVAISTRLDAAAVRTREQFGRREGGRSSHPRRVFGGSVAQVPPGPYPSPREADSSPALKFTQDCPPSLLNAHPDRRCPTDRLYFSPVHRTIIPPWFEKHPPSCSSSKTIRPFASRS